MASGWLVSLPFLPLSIRANGVYGLVGQDLWDGVLLVLEVLQELTIECHLKFSTARGEFAIRCDTVEDWLSDIYIQVERKQRVPWINILADQLVVYNMYKHNHGTHYTRRLFLLPLYQLLTPLLVRNNSLLLYTACAGLPHHVYKHPQLAKIGVLV